MTVSSLYALLSFADLGLGNGLLNAVSSASGRDDRVAIRRLIASAFAMLGILALASLLLLLLLLPLLDLAALLGLRSELAIKEVPTAFAVFAFCFSLGLISAALQRVQLGLQLGYLNGILNGVGALLGLAGVLLAIRLQCGLPWLLLALMGGPLISNYAAGIWFFARSQPDLLPRRADIRFSEIRQLLSVGAFYFALQLMGALSYGADNVIGSHFAGPVAVGEFAVAARMFGLVSLLASISLNSLWPAYSEAIARGDIRWVRKTLNRSIIQIGVGISALAVGLLVCFDSVTDIWIHKKLDLPWALLVGLAGWAVIGSVGNAIAIFLNGALVVRAQLFIAGFFAVSSLSAKVVLTERWGLVSIPWIVLIFYLVTTLVPYWILLPKVFRKLDGTADLLRVSQSRP